MEVRKFLTDDRAVSPVVGVALLIAITVILAAVIGGVVLGLGTSSADAPQASLQMQEVSGTSNVTISHEGGDSLNGSNVVVRAGDGTQVQSSLPLSAGETSSEMNVTSYDKINVVWKSPNNGEESVLASFDVSDI